MRSVMYGLTQAPERLGFRTEWDHPPYPPITTEYKDIPVTIMGLGMNGTGFKGAFTANVEKVINATIAQIPGRVLNLFSGRSTIGDERIDLDRPEATKRMDVLEYVTTSHEDFEWVILDPPYEQVSPEKLGYTKSISLSSDVTLRHAVLDYCRSHARHLLWLDYSLPRPSGFERVQMFMFAPGGYHSLVVLSHLRNTHAIGEE